MQTPRPSGRDSKKKKKQIPHPVQKANGVRNDRKGARLGRRPLQMLCGSGGGGGDYGGGDVDGVAVEEAAEAFDGFADG